MKKIVITLITITLFAGCSGPDVDITQYKWLEGRWEGFEGDMKTFEEWGAIKNNAIEGIGGVTADGDTMFSEVIKIEIIDNDEKVWRRKGQSEYPKGFPRGCPFNS